MTRNINNSTIVNCFEAARSLREYLVYEEYNVFSFQAETQHKKHEPFIVINLPFMCILDNLPVNWDGFHVKYIFCEDPEHQINEYTIITSTKKNQADKLHLNLEDFEKVKTIQEKSVKILSSIEKSYRFIN
ncbi:hypothetical protein C0583_06570 [Candidatus Parcubacteria bacterium]|nr:MAG: hypothetical protein C0583_06570 [Candidatus Parcubacteria bacterium]